MKFKSTKDVSSSRFVSLIVGASGAGKTSQVRHLSEEETLIISAESGLLCLGGTDYAVAEINSTEDLMNVYKFLTIDPPKFKYIFIDSLTEILEIVLAELKEDPKYADPKNTLKMYGAYNEQATKIIKAFRDLTNYSVIFTCLDENAKNGVEIVKEFNVPGSSIKNNLMAWFDLVLHLQTFKTEDGETVRKFITDVSESPLAKDRSGKLEPYENANLGEIIIKVLGE